MNWDYFFRLSPTAEAVEIMLREEYNTGFTANEFTRDIQFEEYFGSLGNQYN